MVTEVREVQFQNASSLMDMTESGITTEEIFSLRHLISSSPSSEYCIPLISMIVPSPSRLINLSRGNLFPLMLRKPMSASRSHVAYNPAEMQRESRRKTHECHGRPTDADLWICGKQVFRARNQEREVPGDKARRLCECNCDRPQDGHGRIQRDVGIHGPSATDCGISATSATDEDVSAKKLSERRGSLTSEIRKSDMHWVFIRYSSQFQNQFSDIAGYKAYAEACRLKEVTFLG